MGILALRWLSLDALWLLVLSALVVVVAGGKSARFLGLGVVGGVVAVGVFFVWLISTGFDDLDKMG